MLAAALITFTGCNGAGSGVSSAASGQSGANGKSVNFPNKTIQIVCPVKAGGDTDRNARALAKAMQKYLNTTVVVTNVDGGATVTGMQQVVHAKPDGYTLIVNGTDIFVPNMMGTTDITLDSFKSVAIPVIDKQYCAGCKQRFRL